MDNLNQLAVRAGASIAALLHNGLAALGALVAIALLMGARPVVDHGTKIGEVADLFGTLPGLAVDIFPTQPGPATAVVRAQARPAAAVFGTTRHDGISPFSSAADMKNPQHRALAQYVSRKYRVALDASEHLIGTAHQAGNLHGMDPLLILAVVAVESRFNPIAESVMGAKGLMQVIPRFHRDKLAEYDGEDLVLDPVTNILVGTRILKDAVRRGGGLMPGLQLYNGAFGDETQQYAQKVIAEKERMQQSLKRW